MRKHFSYYINFFFCRINAMGKRKLYLHLFLVALTIFSAICFARMLQTVVFSRMERHVHFDSEQDVVQWIVKISEIEKNEALLLASYERARESAIHSSGKDPFLRLGSEEIEAEAYVENPPAFRVRGLLVSGARMYASVELNGASLSELLQVGSNFDEGRGKITAISPEGVSWYWGGKQYKTSL